MSGLDVCRAVRRESRIPIMVMSAQADEVDVVVGLELGADDYMVKPLGTGELVARLRVLTRPVAAEDASIVTVGPLKLDPASRTATVAGSRCALSAKSSTSRSNSAATRGAPCRARSCYGPSGVLTSEATNAPSTFTSTACAACSPTARWRRLRPTVRGVGFRLDA